MSEVKSQKTNNKTNDKLKVKLTDKTTNMIERRTMEFLLTVADKPVNIIQSEFLKYMTTNNVNDNFDLNFFFNNALCNIKVFLPDLIKFIPKTLRQQKIKINIRNIYLLNALSQHDFNITFEKNMLFENNNLKDILDYYVKEFRQDNYTKTLNIVKCICDNIIKNYKFLGINIFNLLNEPSIISNFIDEMIICINQYTVNGSVNIYRLLDVLFNGVKKATITMHDMYNMVKYLCNCNKCNTCLHSDINCYNKIIVGIELIANYKITTNNNISTNNSNTIMNNNNNNNNENINNNNDNMNNNTNNDDEIYYFLKLYFKQQMAQIMYFSSQITNLFCYQHSHVYIDYNEYTDITNNNITKKLLDKLLYFSNDSRNINAHISYRLSDFDKDIEVLGSGFTISIVNMLKKYLVENMNMQNNFYYGILYRKNFYCIHIPQKYLEFLAYGYIKHLDSDTLNILNNINLNKDIIESLDITMSVTEKSLGSANDNNDNDDNNNDNDDNSNSEYELIPGGANIRVTKDNFDIYFKELVNYYHCKKTDSNYYKLYKAFANGFFRQVTEQLKKSNYMIMKFYNDILRRINIMEIKRIFETVIENINDDKYKRTTTFLKQYINTLNKTDLTRLLIFWTGSDQMVPSLQLAITFTLYYHLPCSSTCCETLTLYNGYATYLDFKRDMDIVLQYFNVFDQNE